MKRKPTIRDVIKILIDQYPHAALTVPSNCRIDGFWYTNADMTLSCRKSDDTMCELEYSNGNWHDLSMNGQWYSMLFDDKLRELIHQYLTEEGLI